MPVGEWSFIHEWMIYEYMTYKFMEDTLRLKWVVCNNTINLKSEYVKVKQLRNITNTSFPDIEGIILENSPFERVAEVKFITSKFDYHKAKYERAYEKFLSNKGCIIVLAHDEMPKGLTDKIDVFEIDQEDFISFIRLNLVRLLNRQMHKSAYNKIWIMYQGPNFNKGNYEVMSARKSNKWCPTENLNGFELGIDDIVLFIKTEGSRSQDLIKNFNVWKIVDIYIGKITLGITSRTHYCQLRKINEDSLLWYSETEEGKRDPKLRKRKNLDGWRWNRVFEFKRIDEFKNLGFRFIDMPNELNVFKETCEQVFRQQVSRELSVDQYVNLLKYISRIQSNNNLDALKKIDDLNFKVEILNQEILKLNNNNFEYDNENRRYKGGKIKESILQRSTGSVNRT